MTPFNHPACNGVLGRPKGWTEDQCAALPVQYGDDGTIVSFWNLSPQERAYIQAGGCIELVITGTFHPPVNINALSPEDFAEAAHADHSPAYKIKAVSVAIAREIDAANLTGVEIATALGFVTGQLSLHSGISLLTLLDGIGEAAKTTYRPDQVAASGI